MRTARAIQADETAYALTVTDCREPNYDYISVASDNDPDRFVIVSREQLPELIRALWAIAAREK